MAQLFSDVLTDRDTKGLVSDFGTMIGETSTSIGFINVTANPADDDNLLMLAISSGAKVSSLKLVNDDLGDSCIFDLGIFSGQTFTDTDPSQTIYAKDSVILQNAFESGNSVALNAVNLSTPLELRWRAGGASSDPLRHDDELWQLAGLTINPNINLRIGITLTTNWTTFSAGGIAIIANYVDK